MNTFAWNITLKWNKVIPNDFEFDYVESLSKDWNKNLYIFWETEINSSKELIDYFIEKLWELLNFDISISTEDKIEILPYDFEEWIYELVSFEWEEVNFEEIKARFEEHDAIFSVRETEKSKRFWNRVIKVDFVY
jgi:hypothetical protein